MKCRGSFITSYYLTVSEQIKNTYLPVFPRDLLCILEDIPFLKIPGQEGGFFIVQRHVAPGCLTVVIGIAVQAAVAAGIVSADVCSEQTGTPSAGHPSSLVRSADSPGPSTGFSARGTRPRPRSDLRFLPEEISAVKRCHEPERL